MSTSADNAALNRLLERTVNQLSEHFGSVQILASKLNPNGSTEPFSWGSGDWYARQGIAKEFIEQNQARGTAHEISKILPKEDE